MHPESAALSSPGRDAGAFLSPVLEREKPVVCQQGRVLVAEDGKDAAFVFRSVGRAAGGVMGVDGSVQLGRSRERCMRTFSSFAPAIKQDLEKASPRGRGGKFH